MPSKRYTIIVADRSSGVVRRATISLRPVLVISGLVLSVPVLIGIGAAWKAKSDVSNLEASHRALELENASFRSATDELTTQITSLEATPHPHVSADNGQTPGARESERHGRQHRGRQDGTADGVVARNTGRHIRTAA